MGRISYFRNSVELTMRKNKILGLILSEAPWQYYIKYEQFLYQLNHPFQSKIDFLRDTRLQFPEKIFAQYKSIAFYYHDPLKGLYPQVYAYAKKLESFCLEHQIQLIQKPDALSNTGKSMQLHLLKEAGIRVAETRTISSTADIHFFTERQLPFYIRYDLGHDSQGQYVQGPFNNNKDFELRFQASQFHKQHHLKNMVGIEWIDTRCNDGLYRKYRVYATPTHAIKGFVTQSDAWYIHGNNAHKHSEAHAKQAAYLSTELSSNEVELFTRVSQALSLDFCAIDFAYLPSGEMVIWEANPHPALSDNEPSRTRFTEFLSSFYLQQLNQQP